jgi:membrane protein DedA with SNARE-associated domain
MDFSILANQFLDTYGLLAVFGIMLLKELGIPIPIPSDLIMLGAAARASQGRFSLIAVFFAILIPMFIGGVAQYTIAKGPGRRLIYRVGSYIGLTQDRLNRAMSTVRQGGTTAVAVGLTTPGIRIAIIPASGLAELPLAAFVPGLIAGSVIFLALHFVIGYIGGPIVDAVMQNLNLPLVLFIVAFFIVGLIGWMLLRGHARGQRLGARTVTLERLGDWADASCPVCLTIGALTAKSLDVAVP